MTKAPRVANLTDKLTLIIAFLTFIGGGLGWFYYDRYLITEQRRLTKFNADIAEISKKTADIRYKANISLNLKEIVDDVAPNISIRKSVVEPWGNDRMTIITDLKNIGKSFVEVSLLQMDISESEHLIIHETFREASKIKLYQLTGYSQQDDSSYNVIKNTKYPIAPKMETIMNDSEYAYNSYPTVIGPGEESKFYILFTINEPKSINYTYRISLAFRGQPNRLNFYLKALEASPTLKNNLISLSSSMTFRTDKFFLKETDNMISVEDFNK